MKITKILTACCAFFASTLIFTSCNTEGSGTYTTIAFVNYAGTTEDGFSHYVYSEPNSSKTVSFLSKTNWYEGSVPTFGTRLIGQFTMAYGEELVDGSIIENQGIYGLSKFAPVSVESFTETPQSSQLYLESIVRAGNYLDIVALADTKNSDMRLVCDASSLNTDTPNLYLVYTLNQSNEGYVESAYFASFDISMIVNNPGIKNIRVMVSNANGQSNFTLPINIAN